MPSPRVGGRRMPLRRQEALPVARRARTLSGLSYRLSVFGRSHARRVRRPGEPGGVRNGTAQCTHHFRYEHAAVAGWLAAGRGGPAAQPSQGMAPPGTTTPSSASTFPARLTLRNEAATPGRQRPGALRRSARRGAPTEAVVGMPVGLDPLARKTDGQNDGSRHSGRPD